MNKIIFPGSFDPITNGHVDLIKRASIIFDEITIVVIDCSKKKTLINNSERVQLIEQVIESENLKGVSVDTTKMMISKYCRENNNYLILRGLRNTSDLSFEHNMNMHNVILEPKIETICLLAKQENFHISSSAVREIYFFNGTVDHLVPKQVANKLKELNETL